MWKQGTREWIKWVGLASAIISLGAISYVKFKFVFEFGNAAGKLLLLSLVTGCVAVVLGIYEFRRWQSWVSLSLVGVVAYIILSPPIYVVP